MERNNWNNRQGYTNDRNRSREKERRVDEDVYRGAYRLDNTSDHRNETTWDGFDRRDDRNRRGMDYNQDYNRNYNSDYNRNYNSDQRPYRSESEKGSDFSRDSRSQNRSGNNQSWDQQYQPTSGGYGTRFGGRERDNQNRDRYGAGNFNVDYSPDNYGSRTKGLNEGNMAGSLSFGYDGDNNADPDGNRRYDPLSGHRHSNYESRRPERGQYRGNRNQFDSSNENDWF